MYCTGTGIDLMVKRYMMCESMQSPKYHMKDLFLFVFVQISLELTMKLFQLMDGVVNVPRDIPAKEYRLKRALSAKNCRATEIWVRTR